MSVEYEDTIKKVAEAITFRTAEGLSARKSESYRLGHYCPVFSFIDRNGKFMCVWCSNIKEGDTEILRIHNIDRGLHTDSKEPKSWAAVAKAVMRFYNPPVDNQKVLWSTTYAKWIS